MPEEERELDLFGTRAPYWQRELGLGRPWTPTERGRKGCVVMLYVTFASVVLVLVIAGVTALLR